MPLMLQRSFHFMPIVADVLFVLQLGRIGSQWVSTTFEYVAGEVAESLPPKGRGFKSDLLCSGSCAAI